MTKNLTRNCSTDVKHKDCRASSFVHSHEVELIVCWAESKQEVSGLDLNLSDTVCPYECARVNRMGVCFVCRAYLYSSLVWIMTV